MALFFLLEIGAVLTAAGQAALTAIGNGAVLSMVAILIMQAR